MDRFKDYIQQNADRLDIDEPRELVWENIQQRMQPAKVRPLVVYMRWAAAACVITLAGLAIWMWPKDNQRLAYTTPKEEQTTKTAETTEASKTEDPEEAIAIAPSTKHDKTADVKKKTPLVKNKTTEANSTGADDENVMLHNMEFGFTQVIDMKLEKIRTTPLLSVDAEYFDVFKKQFYQLDQDEKAVKKKMISEGTTDEALEQLINIYQQKINVLKQLQNEINKTNKYRKPHPANVLPEYMNI